MSRSQLLRWLRDESMMASEVEGQYQEENSEYQRVRSDPQDDG
jgi:hypothetical protein